MLPFKWFFNQRTATGLYFRWGFRVKFRTILLVKLV